MADYILDQFVSVRPGEWYRLFPYGTITRAGKTREVNSDTAFNLPNFRPPIKLGSHDDTAPAGGFIVAIEPRSDGWYALPEWNDSGADVMERGAYRYHSPEVVWEGGLEDVTNGTVIPAPLIFGDALLHTPALGEAAALYSVVEVDPMTIETVQVPKNIWEKFMAWFDERLAPPAPPAPPAEPDPQPEADEYAAAISERDDLRAKYAALLAEQERKTAQDALAIELRSAAYGAAFIELKAADEAAGIMMGMTAEQRAWVMRNFKALAAQISESGLTGEAGSEGEGASDGLGTLDARIRAYMTEKKVDYIAAVTALARSEPELFG